MDIDYADMDDIEDCISKLPWFALNTILAHLDTISLAKLLHVNKTLRLYALKEKYWKEHCLNHWPWFFWL
jgi:hypothetical protein